MKSLSLLLLFTILSSTMGGKERSQACTPTDGYACCFAPGEVCLLLPKFFSPYVFFSKVSFFSAKVSVNNCDCDAGFLCKLYCTDDMGYPDSQYDGATETCCCLD